MFLDLQVIGSLISSWLNYGIYFIFPSQIRTLMDLRSRKEQSTRRNTEQIFISNNVDASSRTKIINLEFPSTNIYYKVILRIIQRLSATISKSEFKITFYCLNSKIILDVNFEDNTKVSWKLLNTATFEWKLKLSEIQIKVISEPKLDLEIDYSQVRNKLLLLLPDPHQAQINRYFLWSHNLLTWQQLGWLYLYEIESTKFLNPAVRF